MPEQASEKPKDSQAEAIEQIRTGLSTISEELESRFPFAASALEQFAESVCLFIESTRSTFTHPTFIEIRWNLPQSSPTVRRVLFETLDLQPVAPAHDHKGIGGTGPKGPVTLYQSHRFPELVLVEFGTYRFGYLQRINESNQIVYYEIQGNEIWI